MNRDAKRYIQELNRALENDSNRDGIISEYRMHVSEMLQEYEEADEVTYDELVMRLGSPEEIAELWKEEKSVTPKRMQLLFVFLNISLFLGGGLLTIGYNIFGWEWLVRLWEFLTASSSLLFFGYMFFWGLLGYEIGKAFGARGKKVLLRTFIACIIPNLILMYLVVFRLIPYDWFGGLLDGPFIVICILCTAALYPISWLGYLWGKRASV